MQVTAFWKRFLALLLCFVMVLSTIPMAALAEVAAPETPVAESPVAEPEETPEDPQKEEAPAEEPRNEEPEEAPAEETPEEEPDTENPSAEDPESPVDEPEESQPENPVAPQKADIPMPVAEGDGTAAESITVTLTVSVNGVLAKDNDGTAMVEKSVTVTDINEDGSLTYDEAMVAAHDAYCPGGYATATSSYGLSVTKLWNVEYGSYLFCCNDVPLSNGVGTDTVLNGDRLYAAVMQDSSYYSDYYTYFSATTMDVEVGDELTLSLCGFMGMGYGDPEAIKNVSVGTWDSGSFTALEGKTTDGTGSVKLSFDTAGTYLVTASGTVADVTVTTDWSTGATGKVNAPITAPYCVVTVTEKQEALPVFENIQLYASESAYNSGANPFTISPDFVGTTYTGYTVKVPDTQTTNFRSQIDVYLVATPSQAMIDSGYSGTVTYYNAPPAPNLPMEFITQSEAYTAGTTPFAETVSARSNVINVSLDDIEYAIQVEKYNTLKSLTTSETLEQSFDANVFTYHATVGSDTESVTISLTPSYAATTVTIGEQTITSGKEYTFDNWDDDGKLTLKIQLTRSGYADSTYTVVFEKVTAEELNPTITAQPQDGNYVVEETATDLTVTAIGSGTLSYQWYSNTAMSTENGTRITGATANAYTPATNAVGTAYYYCIVTNTIDGLSATVTSDIACVDVAPDPTPKVTVKTPGTDLGTAYENKTGFLYNVGDTATALEVSATTEEGVPLSYQWYRGKRADGTGKVAIPDAAEATYTPSTVSALANSDGLFYFCTVTATYSGKTYTADSEAIYVFLKIEAPATPKVTAQPVGGEYVIGETRKALTVTATIEDGGALSYQWYANTTASTENAQLLEGQTQSTLTFSDEALTQEDVGETYYYCVVTNTNQKQIASVVSEFARIKVIEKYWDGSGTEESPYLLKNLADMLTLADYVSSGRTTAEVYFAMAADITLPENWEPIGTADHRFQGILDGKNYTLTVPEGGKPLLGYVKNATVKNLNLYGKRIEGYGLIDNFSGLNITSVTTLDNITIKSGTSILKSGLLGTYITSNIWGGSSVSYSVVIRNCTAESGVTIGYDGTQSDIGSFVGRFNGQMENCVSYATVKGVNYVGGLAGCMDNGMGTCTISGSAFHGTVEATGKFAGGILGGGFDDYSTTIYTYGSAPNGFRPSILNCSVDGKVSGVQSVGGITGGDEYVAQTWVTGANSISGNSFTGTVSGTKYVGGIIGSYLSLNVYDTVSNNTYSGADTGIGYISYLDTSYEDPTTLEGMLAFNTATGNANCPKVQWCSWRTKQNRTDDPLGADAETLCKKVSASTPVTPVVYELVVSGTYKTEYTVGDELDLTGITLTAKWTEDKADTTVDLSDVTVSGYDKTKTGTQTVTLTYQKVDATIFVTVKPKATKITVSVTIMGDSKHGNNGEIHGLARGGLSTWASATVEADTTNTVWDVLKKVIDSKGLSYSASDNNSYGTIYISAVNGLAEFDNGANSGWMYTVNGVRPEVGVNAKYVSSGDKIVLYYTDDYTYETGGVNYGKPVGKEAAEAVDELIAAIGTVSYTDACKAKIDAARKAYDALSDSEKKDVTKLSTLEAAESKYAELKKADDQTKAKNVINLINKIGTVTTGSGTAINNAWSAYNALTTDQKAMVTNYSTLTTATTKWNQLMADAVIDLIDKIDSTVTEDSEEAIKAARTAYDKLTANQKKLVTNYEKLTKAETALAKLVATDEDKEKAQKVMDMIDALGEITADSEKDVEAARKAYDALTDLQKKLVENYDKLEAAETKLVLLNALGKVTDPYIATGDYMEALGTPGIGSVGGEWMVIGLTRSDRNIPNVADYYSSVVQYVQENIDENERLHSAKSTENSRLILALTALGKDVTDVGGHNLLTGLNSMDYIKKQGNNGPIWALIALDSGNYPVPEGDVTRQDLIDEILSVQTSDGGWAISGDEADADMTGMALTALAPYYKKDLKVLEAVDKAIECLSRMQDENGGYSTFSDGGKVATAESCAQVIVALTALGIDPDTDARFVKNGNSVIDAMLTYFVQGGGFKHIATGQLDGMATEQGYYALTAYYRFLDGKTRLYDMTDVIDLGGDPEVVIEETTESTVPETTEAVEVEESGSFPWVALAVMMVIALGGGAVAVIFLSKKKHGKFV